MTFNAFRLSVITALWAVALWTDPCRGEEPIRLGIVGLDTSHVIAFTKYLNDPKNGSGCRVVAGFPGGSPDFSASANRVQGFTDKLRDEYGVQIVGSIEELCGLVDGVLLESVDGRPHLAQARIIIEHGKPLFVDKPVADDLADVIELFRLAQDRGVPCWSSSSFRYGKGIVDAKNNEQLGKVVSCDVYGSSSWTEFHPDLYLYGIHAVEALFAVMGPGCRSVQRIKTDGVDMVVGVWEDGRIGTFRDLQKGKGPGVAIVYGTGSSVIGQSEGYAPLIREIVTFFKTGKPPVAAAETIEIYAFMSAADESKRLNGAPVLLLSVIQEASAK